MNKKVLFVGDEPSSKNKDPNIAFVGTPSFKRIAKWMDIIELKDIKLVNSHNENQLKIVKELKDCGYKVVALGNQASKRLKKQGIDHHRLPHPSPRNRLLNNKKFELKELKKCKDWLDS